MKPNSHFQAFSTRRTSVSTLIRSYALAHILIYPFTLLLLSCSEPPSTPPPYVPTVFLSEEYAGVTHASLRLTFYDTTGAREYALRRDGALIMEGVMQTSDTVLVDTALFPARTYTYRAYRLRDGAVRDSSALLHVTTMDTTSHDFTWEITYLGDGQSYLKDVFAISDTDVWAVGQIYLRDSTGGLNKKYNAAHWNGREWKLHALPAITYYGDVTRGIEITSVFAFSRDDVWMFSYVGAYIHWDGRDWKTRFVSERKGTVQKIWGRSSSDLYFVGTNGSITHYDGQKFEREESGTSYDLTGIWGNEKEVYVVGKSGREGIVLLSNNDKTWQRLYQIENEVTMPFSSVWIDNQGFISIAGHGIIYFDRFWQTPSDKVLKGDMGPLYFYIHDHNGSARNNIFAVGDWNYIIHYNGITWHHFKDMLTYPDGNENVFSVHTLSSSSVWIVGASDGGIGDEIGMIIHGSQ